jgi:hypothetical protein
MSQAALRRARAFIRPNQQVVRDAYLVKQLVDVAESDREIPKIYLAQCADCHGEAAEGFRQAFVPALRYQHYSYLLSQMRGLAVGHRYSVDIEVIERLEALQLADLIATADSISRKSRQVSRRVPPEPDGLPPEKWHRRPIERGIVPEE